MANKLFLPSVQGISKRKILFQQDCRIEVLELVWFYKGKIAALNGQFCVLVSMVRSFDVRPPVAQLYWPIPINAELANAKRSTFFLQWPMPIYSELEYIYNYIPKRYIHLQNFKCCQCIFCPLLIKTNQGINNSQ